MKKIVLFVCFSLFSTQAFAYYSVLSTGEILPENQYTLTGETQFVTNDPTGVNVGARFETGINEASGFRGEFGVGTTDIFIGGLFKYVPYPDVEGQPAIGFNAGLIYASDAGTDQFTLRFEPLVSKKIHAQFGHLIPYGSIPVGLQHRTRGSNRNDVALQVAGGVELAFEELKGLRFMPELGINIDNAPSYFTLGVIFDIDENGFKLFQ